MMKIFFSVGEPSGDLHAANLIRALRRDNPHLEAVGYGGPKMAEAKCDLHSDLTELAVMGVLQALLNLHKFWTLVVRAERYFRHHRPDAVVLVDFPGFNWWIARRARAHEIPVFYYAPPQIWAWAGWRIKKMRRLIDHVLCCLPFEQTWFAERGCKATFVGHPFFDELRDRSLDCGFTEEQHAMPGPLVTILPGSRGIEVERNTAWLLAAAKKIHNEVPGARFAVACFRKKHARRIQEIAGKEIGRESFPLTIHCDRTPELIASAECCMSVSGSVSLELLFHEKPTVVLYHIPRYAMVAQRFMRNVKYITLVNLLASDNLQETDMSLYSPDQPDADRIPFPEYLTCEDKSDQLAAHIIEWLQNPEIIKARVQQLAQLKEHVAQPGASDAAAKIILDTLSKKKKAPKVRPHLIPEAA